MSKLIEPQIIELKKKLFKHTNLNEVDNRRFVHWIINRYTLELCLNYFYQWLSIAKTGSEKIRVPSWTEVRKMVESCQPTFVYKHHLNARVNQEVDLIMIHDLRKSDELRNVKCMTGTKRIRKEYSSMNVFTPMSMAMRVFDNPTTENKQIRDYVDHR